jgi:hypothetical protein
MPSRNLALPNFPLPPQEYRASYFSEIVRAFTVYLQQQQNAGEGRATNIVLTQLPDNDQGLEPGALFHRNGIVHVTLAYIAAPNGIVGTSSVGTVTVVTP